MGGLERAPQATRRSGMPRGTRGTPLDHARLWGLERAQALVGFVEWVQGLGAIPVGEQPKVRAGDAIAVAQHDVSRDWLEPSTEVLAGFDEDVTLATRIDAAMGEDTEVERLAATLGDNDLQGPGVEHRRTAHPHAGAGGHRPGDHELALRDSRDLAGDGQWRTIELNLRHVDLASERERHAGRRPGLDDARDTEGVADRPRHHVVETLPDHLLDHAHHVLRPAGGGVVSVVDQDDGALAEAS